MRRYSKYILMLALTFSFSACKEDFLEFIPEDQATVNAWYRNAEEVRQSTAALYGRPWFGFNDVFSWAAGDLMAGDMHHNWDQEGQFFYLSYNENNSHIRDGWQGLYDVISFANLVIDDMPTIAKGYGVSEADINKGLAEARFFRGVCYFYLVEFWGTAPIIEKPAEKVTSGKLQLPKNTSASLYEFARRDLVFAAENLPSTDDPGRVTQWAAKGMLAKLHVTLGQRSVGGGGIGSAADFTTAANYAADVINNSGRQLSSNYEDMFKVENEHNSEILFALQWINGGWGFGNSRQARFARHTRVTGDAQAWGGGKGMSINFLNTFENNAEGETDKRGRAIFMQSGDYYNYIAKPTGYTYNIVYRDAQGVAVEGATPTLTSLKKYVIGSAADHGYVISNQDSPLDLYMLRLSDVYLLYAEALLGGGTSLNSGPGYDAYVAVRERAGLDAPADGNMTYQDLFNERRVEFALEGLSWFDVKRRYYRNPTEALSYLNSQGRTDRYYRINSSDAQENTPAGYELVAGGGGVGSNPVNVNTDPIVTFTAAKMLLPIPGSEVVSNPLLKADVEAVEYEFD
jgi:starch-binding outer membrane protein, SusD/RagB family